MSLAENQYKQTVTAETLHHRIESTGRFLLFLTVTKCADLLTKYDQKLARFSLSDRKSSFDLYALVPLRNQQR